MQARSSPTCALLAINLYSIAPGPSQPPLCAREHTRLVSPAVALAVLLLVRAPRRGGGGRGAAAAVTVLLLVLAAAGDAVVRHVGGGQAGGARVPGRYIVY
jgi:hypothetical protein